MSSIDLIILGMVLERPQSAYEIEKDVEYHHLSRWTRISVPSIYKKVLQLTEKGYLKSEAAGSGKLPGKAVYSVTPRGREYFLQLMDSLAGRPVLLPLDFNVLITNLNKLERPKALRLVEVLRAGITAAAAENKKYAQQYADIPLVGRTVFLQQGLLYRALLEWLETFYAEFSAEE